MPLSYLDQNALIKMGRRGAGSHSKLLAAIDSGDLTIVVSPWHLIETAHTANVQNAIRLAEFIDSLKPLWIFDRFDILRIEIEEDFGRFASLKYQHRARVTSRSAVWAALNGKKESSRFDISSPRFVEQWIKNPDQLEPVEKAYADNTKALMGIRKLVREGKITEEIRQQTKRTLLRALVPELTPAGLVIGREVTAAYIEQVKTELIPTLAIEHAIAEQEWISKGNADRNSLIDKFHLTALPHVDEIVSDDKFFHRLYPFTLATGHARARLSSNKAFLGRF